MSLAEFLKNKESKYGFKEEADPDVIGLDFDIMKQDHANGVQIAESCEVAFMEENFAWMRGHQNCWTGFPNDGKTQFTLFMMTIKSLRSGWKWIVWSPEMKGANYVDGKVKVHYNILAYDIMATLSGKTPYKHIHEKYGTPFMTLDEIKKSKDWIDKHFVFLNPREKKIHDIYKVLKRQFENNGFDGILIDPFKNIEAEHNVRDDKHLHDVFSKFKDFAVETNSVMNWIAHPKSNVSRIANKNGEDVLVPCNQYMLSGGAAWDNSMDGIYSIQRPDGLEEDGQYSTAVKFHNLKQRMQELVANRGTVDKINFSVQKRRYYFNDVDVISFPKLDKKPEKFPEGDNNFDSQTGEVFKVPF